MHSQTGLCSQMVYGSFCYVLLILCIQSQEQQIKVSARNTTSLVRVSFYIGLLIKDSLHSLEQILTIRVGSLPLKKNAIVFQVCPSTIDATVNH